MDGISLFCVYDMKLFRGLENLDTWRLEW